MKALSKEASLTLFSEYFDETTGRGVVLVDGNGIIHYANPQFYRFVGLSRESGLVGRPFTDSFDRIGTICFDRKQDRNAFQRIVQPFCAFKKHQARVSIPPALWLSLSGKPMNSGGYAFTVTDVTRTRRAFDALKRTNRATVIALADLAESRDNNTGEHVLRVARMTHEITMALREARAFSDGIINDEFVQMVGVASTLHDVGKVTTPDSILLKPGPLDEEERAIMCRHAKAGYEIIRRIDEVQTHRPYFSMAARIARSHHEKYQGGGYPDGIAGEEIPLEGRIVAVSDVYDALTSWRPYKQPWPEEKARRFIMDQAGSEFDPKVVAAFERIIERRQSDNRHVWTSAMSVGVDVLDKDHRMLFSLANQLLASSRGDDLIMQELVVEELFNYTCRHFEREERLLERAGYPELARHRQLHRHMSDKVGNLRRRFLDGYDRELSGELADMLGNWLNQHILGEDTRYAEVVQRRMRLDEREIGRI